MSPLRRYFNRSITVCSATTFVLDILKVVWTSFKLELLTHDVGQVLKKSYKLFMAQFVLGMPRIFVFGAFEMIEALSSCLRFNGLAS